MTWVPDLAGVAGCICRWTCRTRDPGWTLDKRHPGCKSAVHAGQP